MKKFCIASSLKNIETVRFVSKRLVNAGFEHTYDWTLNDNITSIDQLKDIGKKELDAVLKSDFIVVLIPAGKGSHVELGIALGNGIKAYLYSENDEINDLEVTSTFYHLEGVCKCKGTVEELIQTVLEDQKAKYEQENIMSLIGKLIVELENLKVKWALCGGLAIDSFLGYSSRNHKDLDIAVSFGDIEEVIEYLTHRGWKAYAPVGQGRFVAFNQVLDNNNFYFDNVWCFKEDAHFIIETNYEDGFRFFELNRSEQIDLDFIEVLCSKEDLGRYIYLKNDAITRRIDKAYIDLVDFKILAPEIILLYKLRTVMNMDYKQDFDLVIDKLSDEQREWLKSAIEIEYPEGHEWLKRDKK